MLRRSASATSVRGMARTRDFEQQAAATSPTWWPRPRDRGRERERGQRCPVQWRCCWRCLWPAGGRSRQRLVGRVRSATPKGESPMLRAARWCLPRRVGAGQECEHQQLLRVPMLGVPSDCYGDLRQANWFTVLCSGDQRPATGYPVVYGTLGGQRWSIVSWRSARIPSATNAHCRASAVELPVVRVSHSTTWSGAEEREDGEYAAMLVG